ncbi:MAG: glycosyltransferase family 4 protein [Anaerolineaceae bacterium]|nr:glycosyltransferase family 4 protein [Anaerolineaceae bacterium]
MTVQRFSQFELRDLYAMSDFLVMPFVQRQFQVGVIALLEAMAMGKAVICSSTPGQTDVVVAVKPASTCRQRTPSAAPGDPVFAATARTQRAIGAERP